MVGQAAVGLLYEFTCKKIRARELASHYFIWHMGLTQHSPTHTAQKLFLEMESDNKNFMTVMKVKLEGRHLDKPKANPILALYKKMLNVKGFKTIQARASTSDIRHITLAVIVSASGKMLMPFLIFKG